MSMTTTKSVLIMRGLLCFLCSTSREAQRPTRRDVRRINPPTLREREEPGRTICMAALRAAAHRSCIGRSAALGVSARSGGRAAEALRLEGPSVCVATAQTPRRRKPRRPGRLDAVRMTARCRAPRPPRSRASRLVVEMPGGLHCYPADLIRPTLFGVVVGARGATNTRYRQAIAGERMLATRRAC